MYAYEWAESLNNRYCRTPYYLGDYRSKEIDYQVRDHGANVSCEWIGDYSSSNGSFNDQVFRVEIIYDKTSREIRSFRVTRERIEDGSHFGTQYGERAVSSDNKKAFYSVFRGIITKEKPIIGLSSAIEYSNDPESKVADVLRKWNDNEEIPVSDLQCVCKFLLESKRFDEDAQYSILNGLRSREDKPTSWGEYAVVISEAILKLPSWKKQTIDEIHHILDTAKGIINSGANHWDSKLDFSVKRMISALEYYLI